jgi:hypothetical protein
MPELISFSQFYAGIRAHFAQNPWEYDKYKNNKTNRAKVEYLLGHAIVQNSLATLSAANTSSPLCSIFGNAGKNKDMDKCKGKFSPPRIVGSGKYPQMSKKIEVKATKKKGRIMVAKEKIDPGEWKISHLFTQIMRISQDLSNQHDIKVPATHHIASHSAHVG